MAIVIREATAKDFDAVGNIFLEELQFHTALLPDRIQVADPIMTRDWYQELLDNPLKMLFVAVQDGEIVGLVLLVIMANADDPVFRPRRYVYVDELAVAEKHRGQGIGQQLMIAAQQWTQAQGIGKIELHVWEENSGAIAFYERLCYKPLQRRLQLKLE